MSKRYLKHYDEITSYLFLDEDDSKRLIEEDIDEGKNYYIDDNNIRQPLENFGNCDDEYDEDYVLGELWDAGCPIYEEDFT